jgi:hypothetical protein
MTYLKKYFHLIRAFFPDSNHKTQKGENDSKQQEMPFFNPGNAACHFLK